MTRKVKLEKISYIRFQMPCGKPANVSDLTSEEISLAEMFGVSPENLICCPATGDSMIDEGIVEGDLLFVDSAVTPKQNDVILAEIDGEITVKKLEKHPHLRLIASNSKLNYAPIEPKYKFHIIGVVVGSFRFRK